MTVTSYVERVPFTIILLKDIGRQFLEFRTSVLTDKEVGRILRLFSPFVNAEGPPLPPLRYKFTEQGSKR